ncbi:alpha-glucosidase [Bacillus sp. IITD106]|nr:alpha-glucosidase [Bacillus sp. IITD106]
MTERKWWKEAVVYQIYPKSFYDSDQNGVGDIRGIIEKLDYLEDLGIDVIWICPVYESPMVDNGYDISNYYHVDPLFGTDEDLDELIKKAKDKNIKIIMDLVINHCSDQHEWFQKAISDPQSEERDYFIIKNKEEINNWRSIFGGSVWTQIKDTDEYYMHVFAKEQPDLNWENPKLRQELYKMVNYWLDKGVAGFRVDAITYIKKNPTFSRFPSDDIDGLVHVDKGSLNQKGIQEFLSELNKETFSKYDCMTVAEAVGVPHEELNQFAGDDGFFSMIFEFSYAEMSMPEQGNWYEFKEWNVEDLKRLIFAAQEEAQKTAWTPSHLENHDAARSVNRYLPEDDINQDSSKMLATMYFFLRGTPFIFQGQELGMTNSTITNIEDFDDLSTKDQYKRALAAGYEPEEAFQLISKRSRDNARTPFCWDDTENAGFSKHTPWLKVNDNYKKINVAAEEKDENSILHYYKKLIAFRKSDKYKDVLVYGTFAPIYEQVENVVAYKREKDNKAILIFNNFQNKEVTIELNESNLNPILSNREKVELRNNVLLLKPYQSILFEDVSEVNA